MHPQKHNYDAFLSDVVWAGGKGIILGSPLEILGSSLFVTDTFFIAASRLREIRIKQTGKGK